MEVIFQILKLRSCQVCLTALLKNEPIPKINTDITSLSVWLNGDYVITIQVKNSN